jgi:hypothetical protein
MRHNPDRGIMAKFMQDRAMPIDRLEICCRRRHLNIIFQRDVEGAIAADAKIDAGRLDQRLDLRLNHAGRRRWRDGRDLRG